MSAPNEEMNDMRPIDRVETASASAGGRIDVGDIAKRAFLGFVVLTGVLSLLGTIGSLLVFDSALGDADADAVGWIADHRVAVLDSAAPIASALSDTWTVIGVLVGAASMLWVTGWRRHAATVVLAVLLEFTTFLAVGAIVGRSRPDVEALGSVPSTPSFPSGHTAAAFVLYGALVLVARSLSARSVPRALWAVPVATGVVVAAARVYEGVHHPIDVAAGLLLGVGALIAAGLATGVVRADDLPFRRRPRPGPPPVQWTTTETSTDRADCADQE